jgi:hypothetical protein
LVLGKKYKNLSKKQPKAKRAWRHGSSGSSKPKALSSNPSIAAQPPTPKKEKKRKS